MIVDLLWAHVVGCADVGFGVDGVTVKDARQAKVTQLCILVSVKEYVSWFQISVQNALWCGIGHFCLFLVQLLLLLIVIFTSVDCGGLRAPMAVVEA